MRIPTGAGAIWKLKMLREKLAEPGSPLRHIRRTTHPLLHPVEFTRRRQIGNKLASGLEPDLAKTAKELRENGFAYVTQHVDPALLKELSDYDEAVVSKRRQSPEALENKSYFFTVNSDEDTSSDSIVTRFAMQEKMVKLAAAYMNSMPFIRAISFLESRSINETKWNKAQLWHMDYNTSPILALWVYLTPVETVEQGPFTFLTRGDSRHVKNDFLPRRIRDEEMMEFGMDAKTQRAMGPRLTCFMIDGTRCYHMGSRMGKGQIRSAYQAQYVVPVEDTTWIRQDGPIPPHAELLVAR